MFAESVVALVFCIIFIIFTTFARMRTRERNTYTYVLARAYTYINMMKMMKMMQKRCGYCLFFSMGDAKGDENDAKVRFE